MAGLESRVDSGTGIESEPEVESRTGIGSEPESESGLEPESTNNERHRAGRGIRHKIVSDHEGGEQALAAGVQAPPRPRLHDPSEVRRRGCRAERQGHGLLLLGLQP